MRTSSMYPHTPFIKSWLKTSKLFTLPTLKKFVSQSALAGCDTPLTSQKSSISDIFLARKTFFLPVRLRSNLVILSIIFLDTFEGFFHKKRKGDEKRPKKN